MIRVATPEEWEQSPYAILTRAEEDRREGQLEDFAAEAVRDLPTVEWEVVYCHWILGMTLDATAATLNLTKAQVRSRVASARDRLIDRLAPEVA